MPGKRALLFLGPIALTAVAALVLYVSGTLQDSTSGASGAVLGRAHTAIAPRVAMGGHLFVQFACASCHGPQGRGGVSADVPVLKKVGNSLTVSQLSSIIRHGLGESANPKKPYMPVWGPLISKDQVTDLVAYIRAGLPRVPDAAPIPVARNQGPAVAGRALYVRYGCINCHGPNGLGGVPNPQSADKSIPPLAGQTFRKEFNTDAKIVDFIRSGSVIGKSAVVSMPHWGGIIPQRDLNALVAYLKTLKAG
jgi:mono/diheme cytochrome c family protein